MPIRLSFLLFFFFNDTATTEIYTLSYTTLFRSEAQPGAPAAGARRHRRGAAAASRSEEHTSELQSPYDIGCRLLLEKKKQTTGWSPTAASEEARRAPRWAARGS